MPRANNGMLPADDRQWDGPHADRIGKDPTASARAGKDVLVSADELAIFRRDEFYSTFYSTGRPEPSQPTGWTGAGSECHSRPTLPAARGGRRGSRHFVHSGRQVGFEGR